ncbi:MAG TPA: class I SAM-dependent methyltransferase [Vicinamibacterales bacterium]|nr:class I SAM-dependent methyltransferase [Vicinamibacterales bacterium]
MCDARGAALAVAFSLTPTPPANDFVVESDLDKPQPSIPLTLLLCTSCGHLQLAEIVDPARLFGHYVYVSGTSRVFVAHFRDYAKDAVSRFGLGAASFVVEIGSNDGTLLRQFMDQGVRNVLGVDPAKEITAAAVEHGVPTLEAFFTPEVADDLRDKHGPAALVCANNVFAHTDDLAGFAAGVLRLLADEGVFVFEVSYLVDVLLSLLFDTIYHEHVSYHAVTPLVAFFERLGMRLFDARRISTHGGSIRCYVSRASASHRETDGLRSILENERRLDLFSLDTYVAFKKRIVARGLALRDRLSTIIAQGQRVAGFGAPAKLTTLMYEFGLSRSDFQFIVDDSVWKQGRFTPGTHIPVVPRTRLFESRPEWCVIFAWNFADSIVQANRDYLSDGGRFLVPLPELRDI